MDTGAAMPVVGIVAAMVADTGEHLLAADTTAEAAVDFMAAVVVADSTVVAAVTVVADTGNCSSVDL
jgi:hypothetical protein